MILAHARRGVVLAAVLGLGAASGACAGSGGTTTPSCTTVNTGAVTSLQTIDVMVGAGAVATNGFTVTLHYTVWLYEANTADHHGTRIESSRDSSTPYSFLLGAGRVIPGWDQGIPGMKVGGQRTLVVPTTLAYGCKGSTGIPPNTALVFDIELLGVR